MLLDRPQQDHADLGIVPDSDHTEDLRPTKNAPGRCATTAEGQNTHPSTEQVLDMTVPKHCKHCTVPIQSGDVCGFCASYTAPKPDPTAAQKIDGVVNFIDTARNDLGRVAGGLPDDTDLRIAVLLAMSADHLRRAALTLDKVADLLEGRA